MAAEAKRDVGEERYHKVIVTVKIRTCFTPKMLLLECREQLLIYNNNVKINK